MAKEKKAQPTTTGAFTLNENDLDNLGRLLSQVLHRATGEIQSSDLEAIAPLVLGVNMFFKGMPAPNPAAPTEKQQPQKGPLIDIIEKSGEITIIAEIPGVEKKDIAFTINNQSGTAEIMVQKGPSPQITHLILPSKVDRKKASLNYTNGIMELTIPKI